MAEGRTDELLELEILYRVYTISNGKKVFDYLKFLNNVLNDTKLSLEDQGNHLSIHLESVWNHSGPSKVPYSTNQ